MNTGHQLLLSAQMIPETALHPKKKIFLRTLHQRNVGCKVFRLTQEVLSYCAPRLSNANMIVIGLQQGGKLADYLT